MRENLAFGLRMRGAAPAAIAERVAQAAGALGLDAVLDRKPSQLSGGQRQRVALGRAMVREPKVFLFDEPLSNLDAKLRVETRAELARLHRRLGATIVYVTHDQEEAMTLGGRVTVMRDGLVEQVGPPMEVYRRPATVFVAGFVGLARDEPAGGRSLRWEVARARGSRYSRRQWRERGRSRSGCGHTMWPLWHRGRVMPRRGWTSWSRAGASCWSTSGWAPTAGARTFGWWRRRSR